MGEGIGLALCIGGPYDGRRIGVKGTTLLVVLPKDAPVEEYGTYELEKRSTGLYWVFKPDKESSS